MSKTKSVILLGAGRTDGNTAQLAKHYAVQHSCDLIDLADYRINHFNYLQQDDDFIPLMTKLMPYQTIIFASPLYWYSISAQLKTFLDRTTELLMFDKDLGRKLRGKSGGLLATGGTEVPDSCFEQPVKLSFDYLGMDYKGMLYCYCEEGFELGKHAEELARFKLD